MASVSSFERLYFVKGHARVLVFGASSDSSWSVNGRRCQKLSFPAYVTKTDTRGSRSVHARFLSDETSILDYIPIFIVSRFPRINILFPSRSINNFHREIVFRFGAWCSQSGVASGSTTSIAPTRKCASSVIKNRLSFVGGFGILK